MRETRVHTESTASPAMTRNQHLGKSGRRRPPVSGHPHAADLEHPIQFIIIINRPFRSTTFVPRRRARNTHTAPTPPPPSATVERAQI